jgi:hypothetical protein
MGNVRLQEIPSGNYNGHGTKKWHFESALEIFEHASDKKCPVLLFKEKAKNY